RPGPVPVDLQALALAPRGKQRTQSLRADRNMIEIDDLGLGGPAEHEAGAGWQPLPARARALFMVSGALSSGLPGLIALAVGAVTMDFIEGGVMAGAAALWLLLVALGAWMGLRRYRYTRWLLDADGFALRRGRMWHSETRVPA